ncbi:hypothetical protein [Robertmurraya kyonggiensis]|uniref:Uncharacterized protein n=1 Tax=Robertmurraya kyonggiensis TaxID=1037680 RepID=A0A4U1D872_9BACI|nr:hypothetical protein [Robertmurraya kyonggiensis]TKC18765.1 hypothetical protein FA727_04195 [Robertmurraya kyonggiensis]
MNKEQIQSTFDSCGLGKLGEDLSFKLWIKGLGENCDEDMLENFLIAYDFRDDSSMLADHFLYHFQVFKTVLKSWNGNVPFGFW